MEFPEYKDKNKIIEYVKQSFNAQIKEEVLAALQQKLEERKETLLLSKSESLERQYDIIRLKLWKLCKGNISY